MTTTDALIDQHFRVRQARHELNIDGKWYAAKLGRDGEFLRHDGTVRGTQYNGETQTDAVFDTYADLIDAYEKWLKQEGKQ